MDVVAIRHANLKALVEQLMRGGRLQRHAAGDLDLSASYLSQLVAGKKMGDDVARKIESHRGLPHGWMDREHLAINDSSAAEYHALRMDPATIAAAARLVRLSFANLGLEHDVEDDGVPLAFAYEYLLQSGERSVTPDNLIDFSKKLAEKLRGSTDADEAQTGHAGSAGAGNRRQGQRG